ncbi:DUF1648 domain-containing protein [Sporosarcina sp. FA9]|uniref:DUF1648 domain-containing protein n=1 Tax=Sporosarcina sp. FA9 TaxID=3413030 RepID=UPI003F65878E
MNLAVMLFILLFITILQSAIPYLIKQTLVFGVTIPSSHKDDRKLASYKRIYSLIIAITGILAITVFTIWALPQNLGEEKIVLTGVALQFVILFLGMSLYFLFHAKTLRLKRDNNWGSDLKQIRVTDIAIRSADEMLPWTIYILPIFVTIGLVIYTATQYANLPELIPTHWGIDGTADAFSNKTPFSAVALLLILLVMQGMMLGINELTKKSGIKINATSKKRSRVQQLSFRKYTSWFLFMTTLLTTILFSFLQLNTIHSNLGSPTMLLALPLSFLLITFIMTALYAFKVGQSGSRISVDMEDEKVEGVTDYDDDQFWKAGVFYFNKDDPSIFVEKRFGVGWTLNFGHPVGYLVLFGPLVLIVVITFLI